jgi:hypothetical protein
MRLTNTLQNWAQSSYNALSSGFQGMMNSSSRHQQASEDLMQQTQMGLSQQDGGVTVSISEAYHDRQTDIDSTMARPLLSAESSVASINEAGMTYSASAKLVRATSSMMDALFNAVA